jgi:UDP-N-acetylenolpyruvoylglucosamine reductase
VISAELPIADIRRGAADPRLAAAVGELYICLDGDIAARVRSKRAEIEVVDAQMRRQDQQILYREKPYQTVLSCSPKMYDDIWTAGKCMYKLEPVVADGGELVIYAPHITEVSVVHGRLIEAAGLKGTTVGGAQVSEKHANFIINTGCARAADIDRLIALVRARVAEASGVHLVTEVKRVGGEAS